MKKIKFYIISKCSPTASDEEFTKNICTYVNRKKDIGEYVTDKIIVENYEHYKTWLSTHFENGEDTNETRLEYIKNVVDWNQFNDYCIRSAYLSPRAVTMILRMFHKCVPVGATYEMDEEVDYLTAYFKKCSEILTRDFKKQKEENDHGNQ